MGDRKRQFPYHTSVGEFSIKRQAGDGAFNPGQEQSAPAVHSFPYLGEAPAVKTVAVPSALLRLPPTRAESAPWHSQPARPSIPGQKASCAGSSTDVERIATTATTCLNWWACEPGSASLRLKCGTGSDPASTGLQVARAQECEAQTGAAQATGAAAEEVGGSGCWTFMPLSAFVMSTVSSLHICRLFGPVLQCCSSSLRTELDCPCKLLRGHGCMTLQHDAWGVQEDDPLEAFMAEINQEVKDEPSRKAKQPPRAGLDLEEDDNMTSFIEVGH